MPQKQFPHCNQCQKPASAAVKIKACTGCFTVGYCSKQCQKDDRKAHKSSCSYRPTIKASASAYSGNNCNGKSCQYEDGVVRLEVKSGDEWRDAGPINLMDNVANLSLSGNTTSKEETETTTRPHPLTKDLPSSVKTYLLHNKYRYRHSSDGIDTNLLILFHGAGDSHEPYDTLAQQMQLPQTATLALSARNVELPLGLGYTWFNEMDCLGNSLRPDDEMRLRSLRNAVDWLRHLLCLLIGSSRESDERLWIPERIFLLGFSAGACLTMELCQLWRVNDDHQPLGGAICVAGGVKTKTPFKTNDNNSGNNTTDVLIIVGSNDKIYSKDDAVKSKQLYESSKVQIHVQHSKGHSMFSSRSEMEVVMEFLSRRLVKRMVSMENMTRNNLSIIK
eukprot:scaffold1229_cov49-Cyclotella_meneghiniana.AAC.3